MIELTVKTLDSRNHAFSLEDDRITVRGFKEHIAESVGIAAESQRLIYCGRVLRDDKKLNDYDVNGKVIHLVYRSPPQPGQRNNDEARPPNQGQGQIHGPNLFGFAWASPGTQRLNFRHTRHAGEMPGNAVYVPVPTPVSTETVSGTDSPVVHLSNSLSSRRLIIARRMLDHVNDVLDRLDDPSRPLISSTTENNSSSSSTQAQTETEQEENHDAGSNEGTRLLQAASAAFAAAFSIAGLNNVTLLRGNGEQATDAENTSGTNDENTTESANVQQPQQDQEGTTSNTNADSNRRSTLQLPRAPRMAGLLNRLLSTQERLRPYIERYYILMLADPLLPPGAGPEGVEENQRFVDGVSLCLHYMSHACHAVSDIIVDMGQRPPRNLRCRPIVIHHSAILQAGIPIQVEAHISLHGRNANGNNGNETNNDTTNGPATTEATESAQQSSSNTAESSSQERSESTAQPQTEQQNEQDQSQSAFGTVFSLPNNVEVLMEVSPENSMETGSGTEQPQNNESNNNNANTARGSANTSEGFPWETAPPPPDFIRNLLQAVASHVVQGGVANAQGGITPVTIGGSQTIAISIDNTNTNAGQSTQARSNMGTHPTTATQTRSTPRPHHHAQRTVFHQYAHPLGLSGMNQSLDFDPFLPCNSHHVRPTPPMTPNVSFAPSQSTQSTQSTQSNEAPTSDTPYQPRNETWVYVVREQADSSTILLPAVQPSGMPNLPLQLIRAALGVVNGPPQVNGVNSHGQSRESLRQVLSESNIRIEFLGSNRDRINGESTIAHVLERGGFIENVPLETSGREENFLADFSTLLMQNLTSQDLFSLSFGLYNSLANIRRPLREFFQRCFPNASSTELLQQATNRVLAALKPHVQNALRHDDGTIITSSHIDVYATVETILQKHVKDILKIIFDDGFEDTRFPQEMLSIANTLVGQLCAAIRYSLHVDQIVLNAVFHQFAFSIMRDVHPNLRRVILPSYFVNTHHYFSRVVPPPDSEVIPLLVHNEPPTKSSSTPSTPPTKEAPQKQPEPEPMETEVVEERTQGTETPLEDGEEAPETVLGSAVLPPLWVPIIGRDGVRQRRQLQMQGVTNGGVTPFSDAYLGGLPSKRRKLIEQQKPRLLVSPTPNNSAITASMERLVREGVSRAGVEEIEGATIAVAADAGVRRAFGQAIRDCIHPHRYGTPDFPDPLRFPNATKYFADHDKPPK